MKLPSSAAEAAGFGTVMFQNCLASHAWTCAKQLSDKFLKDTFLVICGRLGAAGAGIGFESSRFMPARGEIFSFGTGVPPTHQRLRADGCRESVQSIHEPSNTASAKNWQPAIAGQTSKSIGAN